MPPDWAKRKAATMRRAGNQCQAIDNGTRCPLPATDVDHIVPLAEGGTHALSNLAALCHPHHAIKSETERLRGIARQPRERRPAERHPGLI
jgi:5-methylcytosine-specific restriction enzyme A